MKRRQSIFANGFSLSELNQRYSKMGTGILSFLDPGCCFDTQPPMTPIVGQ